MADAKIKNEWKIDCPHCKGGIIVRHIRETIREPEPGEYDEYPDVRKDPQKRLFGGDKPAHDVTITVGDKTASCTGEQFAAVTRRVESEARDTATEEDDE